MASEFLPVLVMLLVALGVGAAAWLVATIFGPKNVNPVKEAPFECGNPSFGTQGKRYSVKYFMVALLFLVFDLETVFFYPWAVLYRKLGLFGLAEMALFMLVLVAALTYVWKKGALKWE